MHKTLMCIIYFLLMRLPVTCINCQYVLNKAILTLIYLDYRSLPFKFVVFLF